MGNSDISKTDDQGTIAVDYFVTKKKEKEKEKGKHRNLQFVDASGNLVFGVSESASPNTRLLVDASHNLLLSLHRHHKGSWQGFMTDSHGVENMILRAKRILNTFSRTEFEVFLGNGNLEASEPDLKIKGCVFYRSCTIYRGNHIVAQTSLMHKLGIWKVYVPRSKFRLTIFPGLVNHSLVVALILIFFDGRKIWL